MKKKKVLFTVLFVIAVVIIALAFFAVRGKEVHFKMFEKYSLAMTIDLKANGEMKSYLIDVSYDGENARISSSEVGKDAYIIGERLYYLEDDTFYWYRIDSSYLDIYEAISEFDKVSSIEKSDEEEEYEAVIEGQDVRNILNGLFFEEVSDEAAKVRIRVRDGYVSDFAVVFSEIDGFDEVNVNIVVRELEDDYKVNISRIFGTSGGRPYKTKEASENVFHIGGEMDGE